MYSGSCLSCAASSSLCSALCPLTTHVWSIASLTVFVSNTSILLRRSTLHIRSTASRASSSASFGTGLGSSHGERFLNLGIQYIMRQYLRTGWPFRPNTFTNIASIS
uniref:Putative secreted protein n=1 Tax=Anopheles marajoara TaxID=58244 RepID=A0A2M4C863_9DIPT